MSARVECGNASGRAELFLTGRLSRPSIAESDGAVEHKSSGRVVFGVGREVAETFELKALAGLGVSEGGFEFGGDDFERLRVYMLEKVVARARFWHGEEAIVEAYFGVDGLGRADPVDGAFDFFVGVGLAGARGEIGGATQLGDQARGVFHDFIELDDAGVFQAHLAAWFEAEIFRRRYLGEIVALDVDFAGQSEGSGRGRFVLGIIGGFAGDRFPGGDVGEHEFDRLQHGEATMGEGVEFVTNSVFEDRDLGEGIEFSDAEAGDKIADGAGWDATTAKTGERGHARVVPTGDNFFLNELEEFALGDERVAEVELGEFVLVWQRAWKIQGAEKPIVERSVIDELQRADAVRDAFEVIAEAVRVIVKRVDAPRVAGVVVRYMADAVEQRIAQPKIGRGHVDFGAKRAGAVGELAGFHAAEKI